jgi:hypothetical protein
MVIVNRSARRDRRAGMQERSDREQLRGPARAVGMCGQLRGHNFRTFGFPQGYAIGVWVTGQLTGRGAAGWIQMRSDPIGHPVGPGFAGSPVWDDDFDGVIGMVLVSSRDPDKTRESFCIPSELLIENWENSGVHLYDTTQRFGVDIDVLASNMAAKLGASQVPSTSRSTAVRCKRHVRRALTGS